jgi:cyclopropane-fatty-acyl-phospholipid synthase
MNYIKLLDEIFSQFAGPKFAVRLWDGKTQYYGTDTDESFVLSISSPKIAKRLLYEGSLGFGESYMDESLDIEGDIEAYLRLRHQFKHVKPSLRLAYAKFIANLTQPRDRKGQIAYHYDLGTDFFSLFLDKETMSYSAGRYLTEDETLDQAQINKLKLVSDWLNMPKESSVIDLGSGWGGFAENAASNHDWKIHGCTLSEKQLAYARNRISKLGLDKKVSFEYRDFSNGLPNEQYDGAVMIEAVEHVGKANLNQFMKTVAQRLRPDAPFYVQFTGRYKPKLVDPWTLKYVFPGGHLPAKSEFLEATKEAGLIVERFEDHTEDYKRTMAIWVVSLEAHQAEIENMFDKRFFRLWKLWMHGAHVNFDIGAMNLFRVLLRKP